jgi:AbrB family transcriptional regulator (stage V sporulation protein T)
VKATGITRRIDDLGRIVIPKEMRRNLHLAEGDALEFLVSEDGDIILRKFETADAPICSKCKKPRA